MSAGWRTLTPRLAFSTGTMELYLHELRLLLRSPRAFWYLVGLVLLVGVFLADRDLSPGAAVAAVEDFAGLQFIGVAAIVLSLTVERIVCEHEKDTWALLASTHLGARSVLAAKVTAVWTYVIILLAALAPVGLTLQYLGGVRFESLGILYAVTLVVGLVSCAVAVVASARSARVANAIRVGVVVLVVVLGLVPELLALAPFAIDAAPLSVTRTELAGGARDWIGDFALVWLAIVALHLAIFLGLAEGARRSPVPTLRARSRRSSLAEVCVAGGRRGWWLLRLPTTQRAVRSGPLGSPLALPVLLASLVALGIFAATGEQGSSLVGMRAWLPWVFTLVVTAGHAGGLSREFDPRTIDLLRATPIEARDLVTGHLAAAVATGIPVVVLSGVGYSIAWWTGESTSIEWFLYVGASVVSLIAGASVTVVISAYFRRPALAWVVSLPFAFLAFSAPSWLLDRSTRPFLPILGPLLGATLWSAGTFALFAVEQRLTPLPMLRDDDSIRRAAGAGRTAGGWPAAGESRR